MTAFGGGTISVQFNANTISTSLLGWTGWTVSINTSTGTVLTSVDCTSAPCSKLLQAAVLVAGNYWVVVKSSYCCKSTADTYSLTASGSVLSTTPSGKSLVAGWNMLGNSFSQPINVSTAFADTTVFNSVWAWDAGNLRWSFFTPALTSVDLQSYAQSHGYGLLTTIQPGDGYWVNSKVSMTLALSPTCSNGATDYPTCTASTTGTCSNGGTDYPTCTPPNGACTNGGTDYPLCTPSSTATISTLSQGGLTWVDPNNGRTYGGFTYTYNWFQATSLCTATINGLSGWRMPTQPELTAFANAEMGLGGGGVWSSSPGAAITSHYYVSLNNSAGPAAAVSDGEYHYVRCVR